MATLTGYKQAIINDCGCSPEEVAAVEGIMRDRNGGVLDGLYPDEFRYEARISYEILEILAAEHPELVADFKRRGA